MIIRFLIIAIVFALNIPSAEVLASPLISDEEINITVYEKINPAIVAIDAELEDGVSAGTGCIVSSDGVILTGSHVIEGCKSV